jgi:chromosome segregation ATPase
VEETTSDKVDQCDRYRAELVEARRETSDARRALEMSEKSRSESSARTIELERTIDELRDRLERKAAREENDDVLYIGELDPHGRSLEEVGELRMRLSELERENSALVAQASMERSNSAQSNELNVKEVTNLRNMLRSRDDAIQSLQARVERGDRDMTELERELDELREEIARRDGVAVDGDERRPNGEKDRIDELTRETGELKILVDKQNQALKDMTAKWDKQREEYVEQCILAQQRGEEIDGLKASLLAEESKREALLEKSNSGLKKITDLEMELQLANEKADELTTALNEAAEEIDELHAEMVFKGGRIASLEKEIHDASILLEERAASYSTVVAEHSPDGGRGEESGSNFGRLREEIRRVTAERARLESEHAHQLSLLASAKDETIAGLEGELNDVRARLAAETESANAIKAMFKGLEASNADLSAELAKTRQVMEQLDAEEDLELEETRKKVEEIQTENIKLLGEIQDLRATLEEKEQELLDMETYSREELLKAQEALDREKNNSEGFDNAETIDSFKKKLLVYEERVRRSEAKLSQTIREKDMVISDLRIELTSKERYSEDLRRDLESLQLTVESAPSKRNYGMAIDPEWHEPDTISKLKVQVSTLIKEKKMIETELRTKIESRDATVS